LGANLVSTNLSDANLKQANLRMARFGVSTLKKPRAGGGSVQVSEEPTRFRRANLTGANLAETKGQADFGSAVLIGADLTKAKLSGSSFEGANLQNANLAGADLSGCDMQNAVLKGANLEGANLQGAKNLVGVDFQLVTGVPVIGPAPTRATPVTALLKKSG
jgi:uncharacterized protein YjbI with pentapeptide repeats